MSFVAMIQVSSDMALLIKINKIIMFLTMHLVTPNQTYPCHKKGSPSYRIIYKLKLHKYKKITSFDDGVTAKSMNS